jgi:hypothetical protein
MQEAAVTTEDILIGLFCRVDDRLGSLPHDPQALLHPSEVVTLGLLFALKGQGNRAFYRWLDRDWRHLFPKLPERTRLFRLFAAYRNLTDCLLAESGIFGVVDTFGIELLHPYREWRTNRQIGRKGLSNHRWIIGVKLAVVLNHLGLPVSWSCGGANLPDQAFQELIEQFDGEMLVLGDQGFHAAAGDPANLIICKKGERNARMVIETFFSLLTGVLHGKRMAHRSWDGIAAHIAYALAVMTLLVQWDGLSGDTEGFVRLSLARFSL